MGKIPFEKLFRPRGIAVLGASRDAYKISGRPIDYLKRFGYPGNVYPVNPLAEEVQGLRSYARLNDIEGDVDVAIIMAAADQVPQAIRECGDHGVSFAVIAASGFAEIGDGGDELEEELSRAIAETGIRTLGPNCLGYIGFRDGVAASFTANFQTSDLAEPGPVGFVSQSGGFGTFMLDDARDLGIGLSFYVSTGNETDLAVADVLIGLVEDESTTILMAYMEGVADGVRFMEMGRRAHEADKPVVLLKAGRSAAGEIAARSHTAALAGDNAVFEAVSTEYGITRVGSQDELLDAAMVFSTGRRPKGRRLSIVSESGGGGVMMTDAASDHGLLVNPWRPEWQKKLEGVIPAFGSSNNPIDVTATLATNPGMLREVLAVVKDHPETDAVSILVGNADAIADSLIDSIVEFHNTTDVPVVVVWSGGEGDPRKRLRKLGIPCFTDTARAARSLAILADYASRPKLPAPCRPEAIDFEGVRGILKERLAGRTSLSELEASTVLGCYGIPTVDSKVVHTVEAAVRAAGEIDGPVVMKIVSEEILHKSDVGGVRVGLQDDQEVSQAAVDLFDLSESLGSNRSVLIQPMEFGEMECIIGARNDPTFGPIVVVGLGGVFVEVLGDTKIFTAPADHETVSRRLQELRGHRVFEGLRGGPALDVEALADVAVRLSWLIHDFADEIAEVEVNPILLKARGKGVVAVDGVLLLKDQKDETSPEPSKQLSELVL